MPYPGIYRAKAQRLDGASLTANIPQVFGEEPVIITQFVGNPPAASEMGWVAFHGGQAEYPVWLGTGTGGGGTGTVTDVVWVGPDAPTAADIELWWDTDEETPIDPRYATPDDLSAALAPLWIAMPLASGWANYNSSTHSNGAYRKIGDTVQLRGQITKGSNPLTGSITTLPVGYRPTHNVIFTSWLSGNGAVIRCAARVEVGADGVMVIGTYSLPSHTTMPALTSIDHLALDGFNFSVTA